MKTYESTNELNELGETIILIAETTSKENLNNTTPSKIQSRIDYLNNQISILEAQIVVLQSDLTGVQNLQP